MGARRANQITKNESHGFGAVTKAKKATVTALEEVMEDKVGYDITREDDEDYLE